jgi:hypothetical protein
MLLLKRVKSLRLGQGYCQKGNCSAGTSNFNVGTSYGSAGTSKGNVGTSYGSAGTSNCNVGTSYGSAGTSNGNVGTPYGSAGTSNCNVATSYGSAGTSNGNIGTSNGSAGISNESIGISSGSIRTSNGSDGISNSIVGTSNGSAGISDGSTGTSQTLSCFYLYILHALCLSVCLHRRYSPELASATIKSFLRPSRFRPTTVQFLHPSCTSSSTPPSQRSLGLPLGRFPPGSLRRTLLATSSSSWHTSCPAHLSLHVLPISVYSTCRI